MRVSSRSAGVDLRDRIPVNLGRDLVDDLVVLIGPSGAGKSTIARSWPASQSCP
ncbi:hypothetical protein PV665_23380 [Streptomyces sp. ID05-18]|nr:hypothetical protein [Streptomyces sp. ID05-18]